MAKLCTSASCKDNKVLLKSDKKKQHYECPDCGAKYEKVLKDGKTKELILKEINNSPRCGVKVPLTVGGTGTTQGTLEQLENPNVPRRPARGPTQSEKLAPQRPAQAKKNPILPSAVNQHPDERRQQQRLETLRGD